MAQRQMLCRGTSGLCTQTTLSLYILTALVSHQIPGNEMQPYSCNDHCSGILRMSSSVPASKNHLICKTPQFFFFFFHEEDSVVIVMNRHLGHVLGSWNDSSVYGSVNHSKHFKSKPPEIYFFQPRIRGYLLVFVAFYDCKLNCKFSDVCQKDYRKL